MAEPEQLSREAVKGISQMGKLGLWPKGPEIHKQTLAKPVLRPLHEPCNYFTARRAKTNSVRICEPVGKIHVLERSKKSSARRSVLLNFRTIRSQLYFGVGVLSVIVLILSAASLQGVMKFRELTKNIRARSVELPLAADLSEHVSELRSFVWKVDRQKADFAGMPTVVDSGIYVGGLLRRLDQLHESLDRYHAQLEAQEIKDPRFADKSKEYEFCLLYTSPSPRDRQKSRMPSSA